MRSFSFFPLFFFEINKRTPTFILDSRESVYYSLPRSFAQISSLYCFWYVYFPFSTVCIRPSRYPLKMHLVHMYKTKPLMFIRLWILPIMLQMEHMLSMLHTCSYIMPTMVVINVWVIMLKKCGRPDLNVCFSPQMNNRHPWQLKKSKPWGPFWSYQIDSSANSAQLGTSKMGQMGHLY